MTTKTGSYKENHYVPEWYQRRFLPIEGEKKFRYLDLMPDKFVDATGKVRYRKALQRWGVDRCFTQTDLYTTRFGDFESTDIEKFFFGRVDNDGRPAIDYFDSFEHPSVDEKAFHNLLNFMSIQKLRTPKGLGYLSNKASLRDKNAILFAMQKYQQLHCAIWTEAVWAIVDASESSTKFIISDHPVTVYNEDCFPASDFCRGYGDPEIWMLGTHTLFALSLNKALVLTNLSWVRNPYVNGLRLRPHPDPFRAAMFNYTAIQTGRKLTELEVIQINYIIKKRALRYIAAAKEDWLYPESRLQSTHWRKLNERYLFMPDPRSVVFSNGILVGYKERPADIFDEYGRRPGMQGFKDKVRRDIEWKTFLAFQGEYARLFGPKRRGVGYELGRIQNLEDSPEYHQYHLGLEGKYKGNAGLARQRRDKRGI